MPIFAASRFVSFTSGDVMLNHNGCVSLYVGQNEMKGVGIALNNLAEDINKVCGAKAVFTDAAKANVVVGTLGHSAIIDKFIKEGKIDARQLRGKRETYIITVVGNQLVIAGSYRRGAIYGIYEVSFAGNISGAVAGTPVQLAFQLGGVTMPETTMVSTPGAANASNNVATSTLIKNCCGDYDRITVTNTGTADVTVAANSAFIVRRLA